MFSDLKARTNKKQFSYPQVWPYLLGHFEFGSSVEEREEQDRRVRADIFGAIEITVVILL